MRVVKVFTGTRAQEREGLGERVTAWLSGRPKFRLDEIRTLQSSDSEFHCLTIVVMGEEPER